MEDPAAAVSSGIQSSHSASSKRESCDPHHACPVTDRFPLLNRGTMLGPYEKSVIDLPELTSQMDGGAELTALEHELRSA